MPAFDEMHGFGQGVRPAYKTIQAWLDSSDPENLKRLQKEAEFLFRRVGITFAVYGERDSSERIIPFDIVPRVFLADEWARLSQGLVQRVEAINAFLDDIYGAQEILKAGVLPEELIFLNPQFRPEILRQLAVGSAEEIPQVPAVGDRRALGRAFALTGLLALA